MRDGVSFHMVLEPALRDMREMQRRTDRATMQGLRAVARKVGQEARRRAPVYAGPARIVNYGDGHSGPMVPGELKRSIRSSRRLVRHGPGDYSLKVGPRGGHVHLYAAKQGALTPFMHPAYEVAKASAEAIHAKAWERAMHP
jgi:hypothetical protein